MNYLEREENCYRFVEHCLQMEGLPGGDGRTIQVMET